MSMKKNVLAGAVIGVVGAAVGIAVHRQADSQRFWRYIIDADRHERENEDYDLEPDKACEPIDDRVIAAAKALAVAMTESGMACDKMDKLMFGFVRDDDDVCDGILIDVSELEDANQEDYED